MNVPKGITDGKCNIWLSRKKLILILKTKISTIYSKEKYKYFKYISLPTQKYWTHFYPN